MPAGSQTQISFGPVGIAGWAVLVLGILLRRRLIALFGLAGVVADVTVAELGGFKAMNASTVPERPDDTVPERPDETDLTPI